MSRSKNKNNHKKIFKFSRGYINRRKNVYKISKESVIKSFLYSYRDRKVKKRIFKSFWIFYINFFLKNYNFNYSFFLNYINSCELLLNKKSLFFISLFYLDFIKLINIIFFYYYYFFKINFL